MGGTIHIGQGRWLVIIYRPDKRSRMNREIHVWNCGSVGVKFPCATRLSAGRSHFLKKCRMSFSFPAFRFSVPPPDIGLTEIPKRKIQTGPINQPHKPVQWFRSILNQPNKQVAPPSKFNFLWIQFVYDIEHLNSQYITDFDRIGARTVASPLLRYSQ